MIDGELEVNGNRLTKGDAAGIQKTGELMLSATKPAHFLFFDLN